MTVRRSVYADKLCEFSEFAWGDYAAFERRDRWSSFFRERIGPSFENRIILEIGCFDAGYLCSIAAKHPATAFIGLDWKAKSLYEKRNARQRERIGQCRADPRPGAEHMQDFRQCGDR